MVTSRSPIRWVPTVQVIDGGGLDEIVIEVADGAGALQDLLVGHDVVEHLARVVDDVAG